MQNLQVDTYRDTFSSYKSFNKEKKGKKNPGKMYKESSALLRFNQLIL